MEQNHHYENVGKIPSRNSRSTKPNWFANSFSKAGGLSCSLNSPTSGRSGNKECASEVAAVGEGATATAKSSEARLKSVVMKACSVDAEAGQETSSLAESCSKVKVVELRKMFETGPTPTTAVAVLNSNNVPLTLTTGQDSASGDCWDFLTSLNDMLSGISPNPVPVSIPIRQQKPPKNPTGGIRSHRRKPTSMSVEAFTYADVQNKRPCPSPSQSLCNSAQAHFHRKLNMTTTPTPMMRQVLPAGPQLESTSSSRPRPRPNSNSGFSDRSPVQVVVVAPMNNLSSSQSLDSIHSRSRMGPSRNEAGCGRMNIRKDEDEDQDVNLGNNRSSKSKSNQLYRNRHGSLKGSSLLGLDYEERLLRLESDKDRLHIQVSCLTDQIETQTCKIGDLEKVLDDKKNVLECTEDNLQRELLTRSTLETQKLELLTEISSLRLRQATLERENYELKDRYIGKYFEPSSSFGNGRVLWDKPPQSPYNGQDFNSIQQPVRLSNGNFGNEAMLARSRPRTPPANAFRRVEQSAFGTLPRRTPSSQLSIFNGHSEQQQAQMPGNKVSLSSGNLHSVNNGTHNYSSYGGGGGTGTPVNYKLQLKPCLGDHMFSVNSAQFGGNGGGYFPPAGACGPFNPSSTAKLILGGNGKNTSASAPNLAAIERLDWERRNSGPSLSKHNTQIKSPSTVSTGSGHKSRGILRIFGKLRRSNSGGLDKDVVAPMSEKNAFVRGGVRATAAPRLGWMNEANEVDFVQKPSGPVNSWDSDSVIVWFNYLGLGLYSNEVRRSVKSGQQLLDASAHELEKELGIKNPIHRKKLILALSSLKNAELEDVGGKLDYHWVIRWLDDIGLPQYKEYFAEARVDGRVLSRLSSDDLIYLRVTSLLHHASIKRAIQLLRIHKFHPNCLCRRGDISPLNNGLLIGPKHVATWTNHRVMEWLRVIDLSEYAPNMRGSGVHGALIIFEPKFNAQLLSTLLSIPANKTLLRRHLSLQVNELVGRVIVQEKRSVELALDFVPISPTCKVKATKSAKVFLRRKHASGSASEELLCPLDLNVYPFEESEDSPFGNTVQTPVADIIGSNNNSPDKVSNI